MAYVTGLDVRHDCSSVPCVACVIGLKHSTGMAAHEKYTCTVNQTGGRYVRMDWWISSKYSFRILPSLLAKPPKDILKHPTGMAAHEKYTCTANQTGGCCGSVD